MIRLWTQEKLAGGESFQASEKQVHYLFHVMRHKKGDKILLFNGMDGEWLCEISELSKKNGTFLPTEQTRTQEDLKGPVLAVSLIKKDNMDLVLQKATELGVSKIVPIIAARSVLTKLNMERAKLIVVEAAEQSERLDVPDVLEPMTLSAFLSERDVQQKLVYLSERGQTNGVPKRQEDVCFIVGPEGGWTPQEIKAFETQKNSVSLNLGRLILRAETASMAILATYQFNMF